MVAHDPLSELLPPLMDIGVEFVSVLADRKFLVVVDWDVDRLRAHWFVRWVVELSNKWVLEALLSCEAFAWVEDQKSFY